MNKLFHIQVQKSTYRLILYIIYSLIKKIKFLILNVIKYIITIFD